MKKKIFKKIKNFNVFFFFFFQFFFYLKIYFGCRIFFFSTKLFFGNIFSIFIFTILRGAGSERSERRRGCRRAKQAARRRPRTSPRRGRQCEYNLKYKVSKGFEEVLYCYSKLII